MLREYYPLVILKEKPTGSAMLRQYVSYRTDEQVTAFILAVDRNMISLSRRPNRRKK